jgi:hypothetical protein
LTDLWRQNHGITDPKYHWVSDYEKQKYHWVSDYEKQKYHRVSDYEKQKYHRVSDYEKQKYHWVSVYEKQIPFCLIIKSFVTQLWWYSCRLSDWNIEWCNTDVNSYSIFCFTDLKGTLLIILGTIFCNSYYSYSLHSKNRKINLMI